jgi:glyoxylase-like metal-dependent hydrolase (beta-lactamase superfamily II)
MGYEVTRVKDMVGNAYLLTNEHVVLVDTLTPKGFKNIERAMESRGLAPGDVEYILITHHHFDHCGSLARLKELSGATVIAGAADAPVIEGKEPAPPPSKLSFVGRMLCRLPGSVVEGYQKYEPCPVDMKVEGGETIEEIGLEVIPLPGHTRGGVGYLDRDGRRAFTGDLVSNYLGSAGMPTLSASESVDDILESQRRLADLHLETVYPGHGGVIDRFASQLINQMVKKKSRKYEEKP